MTPDIIIVNNEIRYRNRLKEYLDDNGFENIRMSDTLPPVCADCENCRGNIIIASGKTLRYSDLLSASQGEIGGVCPKVRFILTYDDGCVLGADCGLAKCAHCVRGTDNFEYILNIVKEEISDYFTETKRGCGEENFVVDTLDGLGFNPSHKGYGYILCAAGMTDGEMITKDVYPDIAKEHKTTASAVERSIRSAVLAAWTRGGLGRFNRYIGWKSTKRPTNGEFITALVSRVRLEALRKNTECEIL